MDEHADVLGALSSSPRAGRNLKIRGDTFVPTMNLNWSTICDSRAVVKTKEGVTCGNVVAEYNDSFVLINFGSSSWHEYLIPKSTVKGYDGKLLHLRFSYEYLPRYAY